MKYTATAISLLTLLSTSTAQSLSDVPPCATSAALESFTSSGCDLADAACICSNQDFLDGLLPVVREACTPEELQRKKDIRVIRNSEVDESTDTFATETIEFTTRFCGDAGVDLAITSSADASSPTTVTSAAVAAPSATSSNGTLTPGNSTEGGVPTSPGPSPQPAPDSGVAGLVGLAKNAGVLGMFLVGAVMAL
ncbi:MAG: hypothetical protein Q9169_006412 [Polycauliona sp. 2 TL-2023]